MIAVPLSSVEIIERINHARALRDLKPLIQDLSTVSSEVIFRTLFPIAIRAQGAKSGPVAMSAYILDALNPPCPLQVDDAVASLLSEWDISIQEVPWYLVKQFGADQILGSVERLSGKYADNAALVRLRTIRYWVKGAPAGG
jgi:hypothetical protein